MGIAAVGPRFPRLQLALPSFQLPHASRTGLTGHRAAWAVELARIIAALDPNGRGRPFYTTGGDLVTTTNSPRFVIELAGRSGVSWLNMRAPLVIGLGIACFGAGFFADQLLEKVGSSTDPVAQKDGVGKFASPKDFGLS